MSKALLYISATDSTSTWELSSEDWGALFLVLWKQAFLIGWFANLFSDLNH